MNIAPVAATSLMLSAAAALIVEEPMRLPTSAVKKPIHSLTSMDTARIPISTAENATAAGCRMRSSEVLKNSKPTRMMMNETISPRPPKTSTEPP